MYYMVVKQGVKKIFSFNNPDCIAFERTPNAKIEDWILNDDLRFPEIYDEILQIERILIQRIFKDEDLYYRTLRKFPTVILDIGLKTDVFGGKNQFEELYSNLKNLEGFEIINKHLYFSDVRMILHSIENLLLGLDADIINYYLILSETQLLENSEINAIWKVNGSAAYSAASSLSAYFTKVYSILDLITKLSFELQNLCSNFESYPKLKSTKILYGERKKLSNLKTNTIFEHDETIRIIESIRHEVVHNGTWEAIPTIYIKVRNTLPVEKFMLFPDFKDGYYEKYVNRYHFYSKGKTANNELPSIHKSFIKQVINTLRNLRIDCSDNV